MVYRRKASNLKTIFFAMLITILSRRMRLFFRKTAAAADDDYAQDNDVKTVATKVMMMAMMKVGNVRAIDVQVTCGQHNRE